MVYVLIAAVASVWGIIFYRIFARKPEEIAFAPIQRPKMQEQSLDDYLIKDSTKLVLNYRDPFLGKAYTEAEPLTSKKSTSISAIDLLIHAPALPPPINWEIVKYNGYIINPANKRLVAIVAINNVQKMLEEGQAIDGVKVLKNLRDSIKVEYQGKQKFIRLN